MTTIIPQSELLKRAASYISDCLKDQPERPLGQILDDAAMRFNLSPIDSAALERLFTKDVTGPDAG